TADFAAIDRAKISLAAGANAPGGDSSRAAGARETPAERNRSDHCRHRRSDGFWQPRASHDRLSRRARGRAQPLSRSIPSTNLNRELGAQLDFIRSAANQKLIAARFNEVLVTSRI